MLSATEGDEISLTLKCAGYDESWNPVVLPLEGAYIIVDGVVTKYKTDANGNVSFKLDKAGDILISATIEKMAIVLPVCRASVEAKSANTDDLADNTTAATTADPGKESGCGGMISVSAILTAAVAGLAAAKRKKNEE